MNENITPEELQKLNAAMTEEEWNAVCDEVLAARGQYPADWYRTVIMGGVMARAQARFK